MNDLQKLKDIRKYAAMQRNQYPTKKECFRLTKPYLDIITEIFEGRNNLILLSASNQHFSDSLKERLVVLKELKILTGVFYDCTNGTDLHLTQKGYSIISNYISNKLDGILLDFHIEVTS